MGQSNCLMRPRVADGGNGAMTRFIIPTSDVSEESAFDMNSIENPARESV